MEDKVRKLYKCDRGGISGMADADYFESHPIQTAVLVVAYIHAKGLEASSTQYDEFFCKYEAIFEYPEENDADQDICNYINELEDIVNQYVS